MATTGNVSTREQILHMIKKQGALSANDIAAQLQVTNIAIRKHLVHLENERLIRAELVRQSMGRPANLYSLTEKGEGLFPRNYSDITLDFLNDIREMSGEGMVDKLFKQREDRLAGQYEERVIGPTLQERVRQLAELQEEKGYMAEWKQEKAEGHYVLTEYNCPIRDIAMNYKTACSCELSLFRRVLNADVQQLECKAKGDGKCVYAIKENKKV
ncbi:transcriptional regulator [Paenibacillus sp. J5C_2022]|uniref:helix-turn-helix transcriptional regulator n=1 Tax=Paenibacillus sp. J5C2022 TaxID=2977129 RepID=UPI0021CFDEF6|nr:metalloregulator ArsR/SmtB family transcription factor [Paenibacillus sp. J5C2022]MCU6710002.1 transcriptional regulator [Paenibacillus sp. J5C2022]